MKITTLVNGKRRQTGYVCWIGSTAYWHRYVDNALDRARRAFRQGLPAQVDNVKFAVAEWKDGRFVR